MNDQDYINNIEEQINSGMYDHLFEGKGDLTSRNGDLVLLDIGANIGLVSIYAYPFCKRIVAVEPAPNTFTSLAFKTINYPRIECFNAALTPTDGPHEFYVNDLNFTASSTVNTYGERITVEGKTLATLLKENNLTHVDVCKCDIEGGEGEALSLDQIDYAKNIIDEWFIEFHNCPDTSWEHKLGTAVGNLARCGYYKMTIDGMAITATK